MQNLTSVPFLSSPLINNEQNDVKPKTNENFIKRIQSKTQEIFNNLCYIAASFFPRNNTITFNKEHWSALHHAVANNQQERVADLIREGADINKSGDETGLTPLRLAIAQGHIKIVELLMSKGANFNFHQSTPLHYAAEIGHFNLVKFFVERGDDINKTDEKDRSPLYWAVTREDIKMVSFLLEHGADIKKNNRPFILAADQSNLKMLQLLLKYGADINKPELLNEKNITPLAAAVFLGRAEVVEFLLKQGANIKENNSVLVEAAGEGDLDVVKLLVKWGADVNQPDNKGRTALVEAAIDDALDVVEFLVESGANVNQSDRLGDTALSSAILFGRIDIVRLLLEKGGDVNKLNWDKLIVRLKHDLSLPNMKKTLQLLIQNSPKYSHFIKEYRSRKFLSHVANIKGLSKLSFKDSPKAFTQVKLEGFEHNYLWKKMLKNIEKFNEEIDNIIDSQFFELFGQTIKMTLDKKSSIEQFQRWQSGEPILIKSGFDRHHVSILIWEDCFILCNRGAGRLNPGNYTSFSFKKELLNVEILQSLSRLDFGPPKKYVDFFKNLLPEQLKIFKTPLNEKIESLSISKQVVGNCSWANSEGIILPFLILTAYRKKHPLSSEELDTLITSERRTYDNWISYLQGHVLQKYLNKITQKDYLFNIDYDLLSKAFSNFPKSDIDSRIIQNWRQVESVFLSISSKSEG